MTSLTKKQINWLNKCTKYGTWTLNPKTGLVDVDGRFDCRGQGLKGFKGVKFGVVNKHFWCENNLLTSLVGAPLKVGEDFYCDNNPVSQKTLNAIFSKMLEGRSFVIAAASLRNEMSRKDWKLIAKHIPEDIRPGVNMLARFGVFK